MLYKFIILFSLVFLFSCDEYTQISQQPKSVNYRDSGWCYFHNKDYKKACSCFTKVINNHNPEDTLAAPYGILGYTKMMLEDYSGAVTDYTKALSSPDKNRDGITYNLRGNARFAQEDYQGAILDYKKALSCRMTSKDSIRSYHGLIASHIRISTDIDTYSVALGYCNTLIKTYTNNAYLYKERAELKFKIKNYRGAMQDCIHSLSLDSNDINSYNGLCWFALFNRDYKFAIFSGLQCIAKDTTKDHEYSNYAWGNVAHAYLLSGDFEKAWGIYLKYKDIKLTRGLTFSQAVLNDFQELRRAGITCNDMYKIKALYKAD